MNQPVINLCIQGAKKEKALQAVMDAKEDLLVKYLSSCFIRCSHEEMILKSKVHKVKQLFWSLDYSPISPVNQINYSIVWIAILFEF